MQPANMKVVKIRGDQIRLQCHCGTKFWATADAKQCPSCHCSWNGLSEDIPEPPKKRARYYRLSVPISPDKKVIVHSGRAANLPEFLVKMCLDMPKDLPGLTVQEISRKEYIKDRENLEKFRSQVVQNPEMMDQAGNVVEGQSLKLFLSTNVKEKGKRKKK